MMRAAWLASLAVFALACDTAREASFGEGCARDDECKSGLVCREFSTTGRFDACGDAQKVRFCTLKCKDADLCVDAGVAPPNANPVACLDSCADAGTHCTWLGPK